MAYPMQYMNTMTLGNDIVPLVSGGVKCPIVLKCSQPCLPLCIPLLPLKHRRFEMVVLESHQVYHTF